METNKQSAGTGLRDRRPLRRRNLLLAAVLAGAAMVVGPLASTASPNEGGPTVAQNVRFENNGIEMAGDLYLPDGFDQTREYPAIVVVHPGGGVKEQTAGLRLPRGGLIPPHGRFRGGT
jgi:acetyl esterase/lipase